MVLQLPGTENIQRADLRRDPGVRVADVSAESEALLDIGQFVQGAAKDIVDTQRASETARSNAAASAEMNEFLFELESDTDYGTQDARLQQKAKEIRDRHSGTMRSDVARSSFEASFDQALDGHRLDVARNARDGAFDRAEAELDLDLERLSREIANTSNPEERERLMAVGRKSILDLAVVGAIDDTAAVDIDQKFRSSTDENDARALILADPFAAEEALAGTDAFPNLTEDKRLTLFARAQTQADAARREQVRAAEKAEADADKALEERQEASFAVAMDRVFEDALTDRQLDEMRDEKQITPSQYIQLRRTMNTEATVEDDPNVVIALYQDRTRGTLTQERVLASFADGLITRERASELISDIGAEVTQTEREALAFIRDNIGGVRGPLAILDSDASSREAAAIREFNDRKRAGEDAWAIADSIVPRYRRSNLSASALPRPLYAAGNVTSLDQVREAQQRTALAVSRGDLTPVEAAREAENLLQLEAIFEEQERQAQAIERARDRK